MVDKGYKIPYVWKNPARWPAAKDALVVGDHKFIVITICAIVISPPTLSLGL